MPDLHWEGYNFPSYRDPAQPWILMTYESANSLRQRAYYKGRYHRFSGRRLRGVINRTLTLREDSDIVARHGLVERRMAALSPAQLAAVYSQEPRRPGRDYLPENRRGRRRLPAPVAWFVSHCNDFSGRMKYVTWLKKFIRVDIFGDCGPKSCGKNRNMGHQYSLHEDPCFKMVNRNYRFYIAFENALCKDYVTEKVFNSLQLNTIPILLGGVNYSRILPPGSFINAGDFDNPEHLAAYLFSLLRNETLYESHFNWRPHYNIRSYMSIPDNCDLCHQLVSGRLGENKVYGNMFKWLVKDAECIYTNPQWKLKRYVNIWREAGALSH